MMVTTIDLLAVSLSCSLLFVFHTHDGVDAAADRGGNKDGTEFWGYVDVRPGAHMFYWLYHSYHADGYRHRPLIIWLQGGPGASSCGYGNFELIGPLDVNFNERSTTWVKEANVLFIDTPVGCGYSYVDNSSLLTTDIHQITHDLAQFVKQFMTRHSDFKKIPLYIFGQSYGGKVAAHFSQYLYHAVQEGRIEANLVAFAMGNAWVSPVDSTMTWGPLLYQMSLVDAEGLEAIQVVAEKAKRAALDGNWENSTHYWAETEWVVIEKTHGVDFYNIHQFQDYWGDWTDEPELQLMLSAGRDQYRPSPPASRQDDPLERLMNGKVKQKIGIIPPNVTWGAVSHTVFHKHSGDFMKDVIYAVEHALRNTSLEVIVYQGQLDIICDVVGTMNWVQRMTSWSQLNDYNNANRSWFVNDVTNYPEMYLKEFDRFHFYWVLGGGHSVAKDNGPTAYRMMRLIIGEPDMTITTPSPIATTTKPSTAPASTRTTVLPTIAALLVLAFWH